MNVASKNDTAKFKIFIGVLSIVLVALAVYMFSLLQENKETILEVEKEKVHINN